MRMVLTFILSLTLFGLPSQLRAESDPSLAPPNIEIPVEENDPADLQAEMERQVLAFLQSVQARWGQSQEIIRRTLTGRIELDEHGTLVYARTLSDHAVLEGYNFRDGRLVRGQYLCLQRPVNDLNEFIDYYAALKLSLIGLYGLPSQDRMVWKDDSFKPLPDYWGMAVMMGHLHFVSTWDIPEGSISLTLTGNRHSQLTLDYENRTFPEPERIASLFLPDARLASDPRPFRGESLPSPSRCPGWISRAVDSRYGLCQRAPS